MSKNVKKAAIAVLYTLSIVVALGVGYTNVGLKRYEEGARECPIETVDIYTCGTVAASSELCGRSYVDILKLSLDNNGKYYYAVYPQCVKGVKYNQNGDIVPIPDKRCRMEPVIPLSDGCNE